MSDETAEPQQVQFQTEVNFGAAEQTYGPDWIAYALNTEVPTNVDGIDYTRNPVFNNQDQADGTAYA